jgi:hypothetical protein
MAAQNGHVGVIKVLIARGADKEAQRPNGGRPLHAAAQNGREDAVRALIELGVEKEAQCAGGMRPLHMAAQNGHVEAARALVELGAEVDSVTADGATAHKLSRDRGYQEVAQLLKDAGAAVTRACGASSGVKKPFKASKYFQVRPGIGKTTVGQVATAVMNKKKNGTSSLSSAFARRRAA